MANETASAQRKAAEADGSAQDEDDGSTAGADTDTTVEVVGAAGDERPTVPAHDDAADPATSADTADAETSTPENETTPTDPSAGVVDASPTSNEPGSSSAVEHSFSGDGGGSAEVAEPADRDGGPGPDPKPPLRTIDRVAAVATVVLLVAAVAAATVWGFSRADEAETRAAVSAAREAATALTTIKFDSAPANVQNVVDRSTGEFAAMFSQNSDSYVKLVQESKIDTAGQVLEAGVESQESNIVRTLVAMRSTVRNQSVPDGEQREYRMKLEMTKEDGQWLVSRVDFLQ